MASLPRVTSEKKKAELHGMVDDLAEKMMQSLKAARAGNRINDTEDRQDSWSHPWNRSAAEGSSAPGGCLL